MYAREVYEASGEHGLEQLQRQAKTALGFALMELGPAERAEALLTEVADEYRALGNRRMAGCGLLHLGELSLHQGRVHEAEALSAEAIAQLGGSLVFLTWALSVHSLSLLLTGRVRDGLVHAERALGIRERESGHTYRASLVYYAIAQALLADGRLEAARAQCARGVAYVRASVVQFSEPEHRRAFLSSSYNRRLMAWAGELGVAGSDPATWD